MFNNSSFIQYPGNPIQFNNLYSQGYGQNDMIHKDQLLSYLDQEVFYKSGETFDRSIAAQLFERIKLTPEGFLSITEFQKVYLEGFLP